MAKRTVLLGMLICLVGAAAYAQPAVIAPNTGGDVGLITMTTADGPRAGNFTLGFYTWYSPQFAGELYPGQPDSTRYFAHYGGAASIGLGLTNWWSICVAGGGEATKSGGDWQGGAINGIPVLNDFKVTEGSKIRLGTKIHFSAENDPDLRFGFWLAGHIPVGSGSVTDDNGNIQRFESQRSDWEWGGAVSKGMFTGMVSYRLTGIGDNDVRPGNLLRFGFGAEVPIAFVHLIGEIDYNVIDGGDFSQPDWAEFVTGARFWFGQGSPWGITVALNTNLNVLVNHGVNPNPFGGIVGITYAAWPPPPPTPVVVPAPAEPVVEEKIAAAGGRRGRPGSAPAAPGAADHHRRDLLRRQERPADQHRQGGARRRRAADEERPERHGGRRRLHRQRGRRAGQHGARHEARRGRQAVPRHPPRHRPRPHHGRIQGRGRARLRQRHRRGPRQEPARPDRRDARFGNVIRRTSQRTAQPPPQEGVF